MKRWSLWQILIMPLLVVPLMAQAASVEILGKHLRPDGSFHEFKVVDGDALSPGDRFQIVIDTPRTAYYSVIYYSRDGKATQLFPAAGANSGIRPGTKLILPSKDNYFTLDTNAGRELMFIVTSPDPLSNIKSVLKGSEGIGSSSQAIYKYLDNRLPDVAKLEITNTGGKVSGMADQVSSGLVRDISASYAQNPWPESYSETQDTRKRVRRQADTSIPEAVRRRAEEMRALLARPRGTPSSSSLRTVAAAPPAPAVKTPAVADRTITVNNEAVTDLEKSSATPSSGAIRRDAPMLVDSKAAERERQIKVQQEQERIARLRAEEEARLRRLEEKQRLERERIAKAEAEEAERLHQERLAMAKSAEETGRLEEEQVLARAQMQERLLQEEREEAERLAQEARRREEQRVAEAKRLEAERLAQEARQREEQAAREAEQLAREQQIAAEEARAEDKKEGGFFGAVASILGGGESSDGTTEADKHDSTGALIDNTPVAESSPAADAEPAQPVQAVVVLQAPIRPQPPRRSAPAPVRVETAKTSNLSPDQIRHLYDEVAASIVSIRTAHDVQAAGFILDSLGHILTSWHVVKDARDIDVRFMAIAGAQRSYKAQVIKLDKFRDLALLKLVNPPDGIQPITLASGALPSAGTTVRVFGHKDEEVWATDDAVITRIAQNFTWFSTDNVIHRGEILQVDLPTRGKGIGALVTSMDYKMLGVKSFSGKETGRTYAVSVRNILDFLQAGK